MHTDFVIYQFARNIKEKRKKQKQKNPNKMSVGHHYLQANTNNVNKTWALLQTTGGKDEPNIVWWLCLCLPVFNDPVSIDCPFLIATFSSVYINLLHD